MLRCGEGSIKWSGHGKIIIAHHHKNIVSLGLLKFFFLSFFRRSIEGIAEKINVSQTYHEEYLVPTQNTGSHFSFFPIHLVGSLFLSSYLLFIMLE